MAKKKRKKRVLNSTSSTSSTSKKQSTKKQSTKKKRLFSGKTYNPRGSAKRAVKKNLISKILDTEDVSTLSKEDIADFRKYLQEQKKIIQQLAEYNKYYWSSTLAKSIGILDDTRYKTSDAIELFDMLMRQQEFFSERQADDDIGKMAEEDGELEELMNDKDKWNILRRLATVDHQINLDKSYASEVLKTISNMIENHKYEMSYMELSDMMIDNFIRSQNYDKTHRKYAEENMRGFNEEPKSSKFSWDDYSPSWDRIF